jgi:hypothetical protein
VSSARQIVNGALRKLGRLAAGREPRSADATDALAALQGLYLSWITSGAFGRLEDVVVTSDYVARPNQHVIRENDDVQNITLPQFSQDGVWRHSYSDGLIFDPLLDGMGDEILDDAGQPIFPVRVRERQPYERLEPPRDGSVVKITDMVAGKTETYVFDGAVKEWQSIERLQLDSEAPRSQADPEGLSATLALELADTFGAEVGPTTMRQIARFNINLTQRFGMPREAVTGIYC